MKRAIVIRSYGDAQIGEAIVSAIERMIPDYSEVLRMVIEENNALKAKEAVRIYGDNKRWPEIKEELDRIYAVEKHGRIYNAFMGIVGMACIAVDKAYKRLSAINRS